MGDKSSRRRIFVGDVQGCADELEDLLAAVKFRKKKDRLWFAGDIVNRGPKSLRSLELAVELGAGSVLGNHDLHLLKVASGVRTLGRRDTLQDVLDSPRAKELLKWLRRQPLVRTWKDVVLVHAGLNPAWACYESVAAPLEKAIRKKKIDWSDADLDFFTAARYCDKHGNRPTGDRPGAKRFRPWDDFYRGRRTVVFGHWAARGLVERKRVRGIDTGCVWGGRLTAWIAEEDRFVSVPARRAYQRVG